MSKNESEFEVQPTNQPLIYFFEGPLRITQFPGQFFVAAIFQPIIIRGNNLDHI